MARIKEFISNLFSKGLKPPHIDVNKSEEEVYNDLGIFTYTDSGFNVSFENYNRTILWEEITQLNVYKKDLITTECICMDIVMDEVYLTIHEEIPGWFQFVLKTKEIFPSIPGDWDVQIIQPAFEKNWRNIFSR